MALSDRVTLTLTDPRHLGITYSTTADHMDRAISRHLPASPYGLRKKIDNHPANPKAPGHFDDLISVSELLLVLAWLDDCTNEGIA